MPNCILHCGVVCFSSLNAVKLAYTAFKPSTVSYLSARPPLVIIHGLFGGKRNWQSIAKAICRAGQQVSTNHVQVDLVFVLHWELESAKRADTFLKPEHTPVHMQSTSYKMQKMYSTPALRHPGMHSCSQYFTKICMTVN